MKTLLTQPEQLREWIEHFRKAANRAEKLAGALSDEQLNWSPPDRRWGVAQLLDHMTTTIEQYVEVIRSCAIGGEGCEPAPAPGRWKPSPAGAFIGFVLKKPALRAKAPAVFHPGRRSGRAALEAFIASQRALEAEAGRAAALDLRRTRIRSPASRLIRLNLGDAFDMLAAHSDRHLSQIEKLVRRPDFPRS